MKITELFKSKKRPTISFEFFPARTDKAASKLNAVIDELTHLEPDFVSVTFGAGGSTREGSYALAKYLKQEKGLDVLPYVAVIGMDADEIRSIVNAYERLGVGSILIVRGDAPENDESFVLHPNSAKHASDVLEWLRPISNLCIGVAGYPEGHIEAESLESDLEFLKLKVEKGAEFIIANYFWNNAFFFDFMEKARKIGIQAPILPGVMPIFNIKIMRNLASLCGASITSELEDNLAALPEDDSNALLEFGIDFATRQCKELIKGGVSGIHIYTMDRANAALGIVKKLKSEGLI